MNGYNFFSSIVSVSAEYISVVVNKSGVIKNLWGVYSGLDIRNWKQPSGYDYTGDIDSRKKEFVDTLKEMFIKKEKILYIMSDKAVGYDWKSRNILTLRHAAGCAKFTNYKK